MVILGTPEPNYLWLWWVQAGFEAMLELEKLPLWYVNHLADQVANDPEFPILPGEDCWDFPETAALFLLWTRPMLLHRVKCMLVNVGGDALELEKCELFTLGEESPSGPEWPPGLPGGPPEGSGLPAELEGGPKSFVPLLLSDGSPGDDDAHAWSQLDTGLDHLPAVLFPSGELVAALRRGSDEEMPEEICMRSAIQKCLTIGGSGL